MGRSPPFGKPAQRSTIRFIRARQVECGAGVLKHAPHVDILRVVPTEQRLCLPEPVRKAQEPLRLTQQHSKTKGKGALWFEAHFGARRRRLDFKHPPFKISAPMGLERSTAPWCWVPSASVVC